MRLVLDTDVFAAAIRSNRGASRQIILAAFDRRIQVLVSVPLVLEYEAVLTRPQLLKDVAMTIGEAGSVLDATLATAVPVEMRFLWRPQLKDPADEMVLETAVNGSADYLATFNLRHLREAAALFGIRAAVPGQVLRKIRSEYEKE
jgi:putative PIN family toxin of toxin-antitoxin system